MPKHYLYKIWVKLRLHVKKGSFLFVNKKLDRSRSVGHAFMPEHHLYKIWVKLRLHGKKGIFLVFFGNIFFIKRHVHVPTCT